VRRSSTRPGIASRPWYRNLLVAPGLRLGYGSVLLPGLAEALEKGDEALIEHEVDRLARRVLEAGRSWQRSDAEALEAVRPPVLPARRHKVRVGLGLGLIPVSVALSLQIPHVVGEAIEAIRRLGRPETDSLPAGHSLTLLCGAFAALALLDGIVKFFARNHLITVSRLVEERLKNDLVAHIARLPAQWLDRASTGT
jgi:ABC-type multidrug transport system fused ATPase/permease subunit